MLVRGLVLLALLVPGIARADPAPRSDKQPIAALALSLGPTLLGAGLLVAAGVHGQRTGGGDATSWIVGTTGGVAMPIGPTIGHTWSGRTWNTGLGIRLGGFAVGVVGVGLMATADDVSGGRFGNGLTLTAIGSIVCLIGTSLEIIRAPGAAARHNRTAQLGIAPIATRAGSTPGLAFGASF